MEKKRKFLPYGRQSIDQDDIRVVVETLQSDWLTTGPKVPEFEKAIADFCETAHGVAVSSGTAGLHAAMYAIGIGPGDEVILPSLSFAATANSVLYLGGTPVFADIDPKTLLIDISGIERLISSKTKAIVAMDYGGHPCDYSALREIAKKNSLYLVSDACHSLGGSRDGKKVGSLADLSVLSFHPVKQITTAEGGMVMCQDPELDRRLRLFRNHGISTDHRQRHEKGTLSYEMIDLGFNYRLSDLQCALGLSQLKKLPLWIEKRNEIARRYRERFAETEKVTSLPVSAGVHHAYHLFVVQIDFSKMKRGRDELNLELRKKDIGVNVHYPPIHLHPYYRSRFKTSMGFLPKTEAAYEKILSLPMHAAMEPADADYVVDRLLELL